MSNSTKKPLPRLLALPSELSKYSGIAPTFPSLPHLPIYSMQSSINEYGKQMVESRNIIYHQQNLRMVSSKDLADPSKKKQFVVKKVARELWTNFCVRGQKTPMLEHLHSLLRKEYGEDLQFHYIPGSIELVIMKQGENGMEAINSLEKTDIINKAWQISQEVVSSYTSS